MKKGTWRKKLMALSVTAALLVCGLAGCGGPEQGGSTGESPENYFKWVGAVIMGLTDSGQRATELTIPAKAELINLTITDNAVLKKFSLASDATVIQDLEFVNCTALEYVELPNTAKELPVFSECTALKEITIPESITEIEMGAFSGCTALEKVSIPETVTSIDDGAFAMCESLKDIKLPSGITRIGIDAFLACTSLERIEVPEGVTEIDISAFSGCSSLQEVVLPESLEIIGDNAFTYCTALEAITIPAGVMSIGPGAFLKTEGNAIQFSVTAGSWADENSDVYDISGVVTAH